MTNNQAKHYVVIRALESAIELGVEEVELYTDSELLVKQLHGEYAVRDPKLRPLHAKLISSRDLKKLRILCEGTVIFQLLDLLSAQWRHLLGKIPSKCYKKLIHYLAMASGRMPCYEPFIKWEN